MSSPTTAEITADRASMVLPIESLLVKDRYRKDLGDLSELAASIVEVGLLNPVTVMAWHGAYRLVAGERRLTACKSLGMTEIPVRVAGTLEDARDLLVAERDENTQRKEMLPSEATQLGMAIEEIERPKSIERRNAQLKQGDHRSGPGTGTGNGHETRELAAEAVGMSASTYTRVKTALTVASDENEAEEVREVARQAVEDIDAGKPIRSTVERIREARSESKLRSQDDWQAIADKAGSYRSSEEAIAALAPNANPDHFRRKMSELGVSFMHPRRIAKISDQANGIVERMGEGIAGQVETAMEALDVAALDLVDPETARVALNQLRDAARNIKKLITTMEGIH